jgi:hypothetical protein
LCGGLLDNLLGLLLILRLLSHLWLLLFAGLLRLLRMLLRWGLLRCLRSLLSMLLRRRRLLRFRGLRRTLLLLRGGFHLTSLRLGGFVRLNILFAFLRLTFLLFALLFALSGGLCVSGQHRATKEDGGRTGYSDEFHDGSLLLTILHTHMDCQRLAIRWHASCNSRTVRTPMNNSPPEQQSANRTQTRLERRQWLKSFALALALIVFTVTAASELAGLVRNGAIRW